MTGSRHSANLLCGISNCNNKKVIQMKKLKLTIIAFLITILTISIIAYSNEKSGFDLANILHEDDIPTNGFRILEMHIFEIEHAGLGLIKIIPTISRDDRTVFFFADEDGVIVWKTDDFQSNTWLMGRVKQENIDLLTIAFRDLTGNGLDDIVLITTCRNTESSYAGKIYNVADVLFQNADGYYRDHRISDKLNRFDMNKNYPSIIAFVRDGISMEFLFTAKTMDELRDNGFRPNTSRSATEIFEFFGVVDVIPGHFQMAGSNYLMVYLVDQSGRILWNFQPMHDYVNFYATKHISVVDINGDGYKDLVLLAWYVAYDENRTVIVKQDYNIYYQQAGYFWEDTEIKKYYPCTDEDNMSDIIFRARKYWGWD